MLIIGLFTYGTCSRVAFGLARKADLDEDQ